MTTWTPSAAGSAEAVTEMTFIRVQTSSRKAGVVNMA